MPTFEARTVTAFSRRNVLRENRYLRGGWSLAPQPPYRSAVRQRAASTRSDGTPGETR